MNLYILKEDGKTPVMEPDTIVWARWLEQVERHIPSGDTEVGTMRVSTVFLGIDHSFRGKGKPVLWETMIFGGVGELKGWQRRYRAYEHAVRGHEYAVRLAEKLWHESCLHIVEGEE